MTILRLLIRIYNWALIKFLIKVFAGCMGAIALIGSYLLFVNPKIEEEDKEDEVSVNGEDSTQEFENE